MLTALIVAAGRSRRMSGLGDKALLPLLGKPLIVHSLLPFQRADAVDRIVLVTAPDLIETMRRIVCAHDLHKVSAVVAGGDSRQASVRLGLANLPAHCGHVAIHDGARPCLGDRELAAVLRSGMDTGAAILAVAVKDTIKRVRLGVEVETPDRDELWAAQTPQVFRREWIVAAHEQARLTGREATDDAALLTAMGKAVWIVPGADSNIKVTMPDDLLLAEMILSRRDDQ